MYIVSWHQRQKPEGHSRDNGKFTVLKGKINKKNSPIIWDWKCHCLTHYVGHLEHTIWKKELVSSIQKQSQPTGCKVSFTARKIEYNYSGAKTMWGGGANQKPSAGEVWYLEPHIVQI